MEGLAQILTPAQGYDDLLGFLNAEFLAKLAALPNAEWTIVLPSGAGTAKVVGSSKSIVLDFTSATFGRGTYEQVGQMCIQGVIFNVIFILKSAPVMA